jgi:hypothetical protein
MNPKQARYQAAPRPEAGGNLGPPPKPGKPTGREAAPRGLSPPARAGHV